MDLGRPAGMARAFIAAQPVASSSPQAAIGNPQMTPTSESLRRMMRIALFGAGVVCTLGAAAMVLILWLGGWTDDTQTQRLEILGWALLGMLAGVLAVIISFAIGGPVGRLKGASDRRASKRARLVTARRSHR